MTRAALKRPGLVLAGLALGVTVTHGFARLAYGDADVVLGHLACCPGYAPQKIPAT